MQCLCDCHGDRKREVNAETMGKRISKTPKKYDFLSSNFEKNVLSQEHCVLYSMRCQFGQNLGIHCRVCTVGIESFVAFPDWF